MQSQDSLPRLLLWAEVDKLAPQLHNRGFHALGPFLTWWSQVQVVVLPIENLRSCAGK